MKKERLHFSSIDAELFARATSLTVSLGLPVHGKYLMTKPMGFVDQCKPSSARPASEARATWRLLLPLLFCKGSGGWIQESEFTYQFIFVQMERTSPRVAVAILSRGWKDGGLYRVRERSRFDSFWYFGPLGFHSILLPFRQKYPRSPNLIIGDITPYDFEKLLTRINGKTWR